MATLAKSNKHLATAAQRLHAVRVTIATSSAIEGIHAPFTQPRAARQDAPAANKRIKRSKPQG
ncbi:MAG: hypothetical protein M0Q42_00805 [Xanthomonadales bacterium]|nr:hypothetical protein [Xanthomonadales bacterium]